MNVNFDGDTIGSAPATGPSANPVTLLSGIGGYDSATTDPYGDNPVKADEGTAVVSNVGTMSKALVLTSDSTDNEQGAINGGHQLLLLPLTISNFRLISMSFPAARPEPRKRFL